MFPFPNLLALSTKALPFLAKNWLSVILIGLLASTQVQLVGSRRENRALLTVVNEQKQELAEVRGALQKLSEAAATLKPGETKTIYVDRPVLVNLPGQVIEKQVPVIVTRTVNTIETKVQTITLPPKEIERIIRESPQSILVNLEATRDIQKGEKFRVVVAQIQPGVWGGILDIGAPIAATVTTVTPTDKIPQPRLESRVSFTLYTGYASLASSFVSGVRADYKLNQRWGIEGSVEHLWAVSRQDYRLLATLRF